MVSNSEDSEGVTDQAIRQKVLDVLGRKVSRRRALSTTGKIAIGAVAAAVIAGGGTAAYYASLPPAVTTRTATSTATTTATSVSTATSTATTTATSVSTATSTATATVTYTTTGAAPGAKPIDVWWVTQFFPEEQLATLEVANAYTAKTGTPVNLTFYEFSAAEAKLLAQAPTGVVPDISVDIGVGIGARLALQDYCEDVTDIVNTMKAQPDFEPAAGDLVYTYDLKAGKRSYYQVPFATYPMNTLAWANLVKQYTGTDISPTAPGNFANMPTDWDSWWGLFKKAQDNGGKAAGSYAFAWTLYSTGGDAEDAMTTTVQAFGGQGLDANGKINWNDPNFKTAVTNAVTYAVDLYKAGYIPSGSIAADDSTNNVQVESKKALMVYANGSLSIPTWFKNNDPSDYNTNVFSLDYPTGPTGNTWKSTVALGESIFIMKDGKNTAAAKDFINFFLQTANYEPWFVGYQYRYLPVFKHDFSLPGYTVNDSVKSCYKTWYSEAVPDYRYVNAAWAVMSYGNFFYSTITTDVLVKGMSITDAVDAQFAALQAYAQQTGL